MIFRSSTPKFIYLCPKCMEVRISGNARVEVKKNLKNCEAFCSKCNKPMSEYLEFLNLGLVKINKNNSSFIEFKENKEAFIVL